MILLYVFIVLGNHKGVNGMLTNDSLKSNPNFSIPLNINIENKVILNALKY